MSETIELTDAQAKRFKQIKEECKDDHTPEPTDELMISSLMDTWDGVNMGIYTRDHTPNEDLRELVEEWRSGDCRKHPGVDTRTLNMCVEQLEAVLEE